MKGGSLKEWTWNGAKKKREKRQWMDASRRSDEDRVRKIQEVHGASHKFRPVPSFPFFFVLLLPALPLLLLRGSTLAELFRNLCMCPLWTVHTHARTNTRVRTRGVRKRIRLDWLRGKDFVEFELETKCRVGFELRLLRVLTLFRGSERYKRQGGCFGDRSEPMGLFMSTGYNVERFGKQGLWFAEGLW